MTVTLSIGRGPCATCGSELAVIDHALAEAISEDARAQALRKTIPGIKTSELLVIANEDGTFTCPHCGRKGRTATGE
jgi:hypothetical protein